MCTSIILFRKKHHCPLIIGSNRDENLSRKSNFPPNIGGYSDVELNKI